MMFVPRTEGGRYRVWMKGSFGRPTAAYIDGRKVGEADQINTPGQWEQIGGAGARQGHAPGQARAPGAPSAPGDGWRGVLGPVALERVEPSRLITVTPERATRLCGRDWDWIELVRP